MNIFGIVLGKDEPRGMQVCIHIHIRVCVEEPECYLDFVMTEMVCECPSLSLQHTRGALFGLCLETGSGWGLEAVNQEFLGGRSSEKHLMVALRLTKYS